MTRAKPRHFSPEPRMAYGFPDGTDMRLRDVSNLSRLLATAIEPPPGALPRDIEEHEVASAFRIIGGLLDDIAKTGEFGKLHVRID